VRYYCFRLQRMCEMAKRTPGAVLLTWDDMISGLGFDVIERYIGLKQPLENDVGAFESIKEGIKNDLIPFDLLQYAEQAFERYFSFLKNQNLQKAYLR
jgi:hypothetical protein